jgi:hypothetical protein
MNENCELASRNSIQAYYLGGFLLIMAEGDLPTPCHTIKIERNFLPIEPPEFVLMQCSTGGGCPDVITPYNELKLFRMGSRPTEIVVHHKDGSDTVQVESFGSGVAFLGPPISAPVEATGRSRKLSFDEAFADALNNLPPFQPSHPDQMDVVIVVNIRGEFGGIAGFRDLVVKVRRLPSP